MLFSDPDGEKAKARKESYRQPCPNCGQLMTGCNGRNSPDLCKRCWTAQQKETRRWTQETIIESFREFHRIIGRSPATTDRTGLNPSVACALSDTRLAEIIEAQEKTTLPSHSIVMREFGSWDAALEAAELPFLPTGGAGHRERKRKRRGEMPERKFDHDEAARLVAEGETYASIGRRLGVTATSIRRAVNPEIAQAYKDYSAKWEREKRTNQVQMVIWLPREATDLIKQEAQREDQTVGEYVEDLCIKHLEENGIQKRRAKGWKHHASTVST